MSKTKFKQVTKQDLQIKLRPMRQADLVSVVMLEREAYPHPWGLGSFQDCLRVGYSCWVGEISGFIVAHGIISIAVGECHLFNLCVHPTWQGRGIGRQLLRHLLMLASQQHADTAFLEVRVSNHSARALYAAEGFCEIGLRRNYYSNGQKREDAIVLARELNSSILFNNLL